jgi:hypothetical protein
MVGSNAIFNSGNNVTFSSGDDVDSVETFNTSTQGLYFSFTIPECLDNANNMGAGLLDATNMWHMFSITATNQIAPMYGTGGAPIYGTFVSYTPGQTARLYFDGISVKFYLDSVLLLSVPIATSDSKIYMFNNTNTPATFSNIQCSVYTPGPTGPTGPAGATGPTGSIYPTGGSPDRIFYENQTTITANYTVTTSYNAGTFGPVTINSGVTITIPSGSVWTIV